MKMRMWTSVLFLLALLGACDAPTASPLYSQTPPTDLQSADQIGVPITTSIQLNGTSRSHYTEQLIVPDATFIKLHIADMQLAAGERLVIRSADGTQQFHYPGDPTTTDGRGGFYALSILGDSVQLELVAADGHSDVAATSFVTIDRYTRGLSADELAANASRSLCGVDDRNDVACFAESHASEVAQTAPVARLMLNNGERYCTGFRITDDNLFMTNEHCLSSQAEAEGAEIWFNYQRAACGSDEMTTPTIVTVDQFLRDNTRLDYALLSLDNFCSVQSFGALEFDDRTLVNVGEPIMIPQHSDGGPIQLGLLSDRDENGYCSVVDDRVNGFSSNADIGYWCDTSGGSSGSPVISRDTGKVIAIHHLGSGASADACTVNAVNRGARVAYILPQIRSQLNNPPDAPIELQTPAWTQLWGADDGHINTGELFEVALPLMAAGNGTFEIVSAELTTTNSDASIDQPSADYGTLNSCMPQTSSEPFRVQMGQLCGIEAEFELQLSYREAGSRDIQSTSQTFRTRVGRPFTVDTPRTIIQDKTAAFTDTVTSELFVEPTGSTVGDLNVTVILSSTHSADLELTLAHVESGMSVRLLDSNRTCSASGQAWTFDDEAAESATQLCETTASMTVVSADALSFFDGVSVGGTWQLTVNDRSGQGGMLLGFELEATETIYSCNEALSVGLESAEVAAEQFGIVAVYAFVMMLSITTITLRWIIFNE